MADRCRELLRVASRDDVNQLREWAEDFDAEADALHKEASFSAAVRDVSGLG